MNISFLHLSVIIFQHHILHCIIIHMRSTYFLFYKLHTFFFHVRLCMILAFSSAKQKQKRKHENPWCILSCIYSVPWANHVGIINPFHLKTKWLNMVPNAWLTKKGCFFGHLNLIITFSMHSMRIPESFIPMKCCWSIGDQNCHSLGYGVEPSSCFYEKVHRVKLKYGSNHLAKIGAKDGSCYIAASSTAKHI